MHALGSRSSGLFRVLVVGAFALTACQVSEERNHPTEPAGLRPPKPSSSEGSTADARSIERAVPVSGPLASLSAGEGAPVEVSIQDDLTGFTYTRTPAGEVVISRYEPIS